MYKRKNICNSQSSCSVTSYRDIVYRHHFYLLFHILSVLLLQRTSQLVILMRWALLKDLNYWNNWVADLIFLSQLCINWVNQSSPYHSMPLRLFITWQVESLLSFLRNDICYFQQNQSFVGTNILEIHISIREAAKYLQLIYQV